MAKKAPRRTAERILEVTLALFNRFGEPNVSTTLISAELGISPGNLYYHYPAKDELINALLERYEKALGELLGASLSSLGARAAQPWDKLENIFEERVAKALLHLGAPSAADMAALQGEVAALKRQLAALNGAAKPVKKVAKAPASKTKARVRSAS